MSLESSDSTAPDLIQLYGFDPKDFIGGTFIGIEPIGSDLRHSTDFSATLKDVTLVPCHGGWELQFWFINEKGEPQDISCNINYLNMRLDKVNGVMELDGTYFGTFRVLGPSSAPAKTVKRMIAELHEHAHFREN